MNNKITTTIVSIVIVGLLGVIGYHFGVSWVNDKLLLERNKNQNMKMFKYNNGVKR